MMARLPSMRRPDRRPVLWRVIPGRTPYAQVIAAMHVAAAEIVAGRGREAVWLFEAPAGYNAGAAADPATVDEKLTGVPVELVPGKARAGSWTYVGPGVRVVVVMLDLRARRRDTTMFVDCVHHWIIDALRSLGFPEARREDPAVDPAGVYLGTDKVAAMGFRASAWVTSYGFTFYVDPNLDHFAGIQLCAIKDRGVTSLGAVARRTGDPAPFMSRLRLADRAERPAVADVDDALRRAFEPIFGATSLVETRQG